MGRSIIVELCLSQEGNVDPLARDKKAQWLRSFQRKRPSQLGELLRNGKGLLLDFDASAPLAALAGRWRDRIAYVAGDAKDRLGLSAVLVRPDGFVAWACDAAANHEEAADAASRWFGAPEEA
jgi:hypothetical protein